MTTERLSTTRRAILSAALALPAAAAITILPAEAAAASIDDDDRGLSSLTEFAVAWLSSWTSQGGSVTVADDERTWIGTPMYEFSRAHVAVPADLPESVRENQRQFRDAHYLGHMRGLETMLDAMPGGRDAVRTVVQAFPILGLKPASEV